MDIMLSSLGPLRSGQSNFSTRLVCFRHIVESLMTALLRACQDPENHSISRTFFATPYLINVSFLLDNTFSFPFAFHFKLSACVCVASFNVVLNKLVVGGRSRGISGKNTCLHL